MSSFPLSEAQKNLLAAGPGLPGAVMRLDLAGAVDEARLRAALKGLVDRHEALRSRLVPVPGLKVPAQAIDSTAEVAWRVEDLSGLSSEELEARLHETRVALLSPREGGDGPVLAAALYRQGREKSSLFLAVPALFADAFSLSRLASELAALLDGHGNDLPEPLQYLDVAEWQRERAEAADEESFQGRSYWERRQASGRPIEIPFALPAAGETLPAVLPLPEVSRRLGELATETGSAPRDLARAAWWLVWSRLAGRGGLEIAEETAGRTDGELATGVGPIGRFLPLREEIDSREGLAGLAARLARAAAEAERWHLYAGSEETAAPAVGFAWRHAGVVSGGGLTLTPVRLQVAAPVPTLVLTGLETESGIVLELCHDAARIQAEEAEALGRRLLAALGDPGIAAAGEEGRGEDLPVPDLRVHRLFERAAAEAPAAPAVVAAGRTLTYAELDGAANRLARRLVASGVGPDVPVGLYLERTPELIVGLLAILKAGGACLPFDTSQPERRIALMLEEVPAPVVVTQESLAGRLPQDGPFLFCLDREAASLESEDSAALACDPPAECLAYVIFTSGSTGRPKGVGVEHRQLESYLAGILQRLDLPPGLTYASVSTVAADLGHTVVFPALTTGGCLHLVAQEEAADAEAMVRYFAAHPADVLKIVPTHLEALGMGSPEAAALLLPKRRLVLGGEATPRALAEEIARVLPRVVPECRFFNHYGPTETTVGVLTLPVDPVEGALDPRAATLPIGRPLPNTAVHVLDAGLRATPTWEPGEVWIGGPQVSRGYLGRPDRTAERFLPDPLGEPGGRLYRTGDLARRLPGGAGGTLEFLGRRDHQVKVRGFRVELLEIRAALTAHPDIRDAVVLVRRDSAGGDLLVAFYVSRQEIPAVELRARLAETLIEEVLPNLFVHLKKLPLTLNGKVNLDALPSIEEARQRAARVFVPPATDTEARVAEIWSQVLSVPQVSAEADFFELGGHSLLATRIVARLREAFGIDLSLRVLFETPMVRELARQVDEVVARTAGAGEGGTPPAVPEMASFEDQLAALEAMSDDEAAALLGGEPEESR